MIMGANTTLEAIRVPTDESSILSVNWSGWINEAIPAIPRILKILEPITFPNKRFASRR